MNPDRIEIPLETALGQERCANFRGADFAGLAYIS